MEVIYPSNNSDAFTKAVRDRLHQFNENYLIGGYDKEFLTTPIIQYDAESLNFIFYDNQLFGELCGSPLDKKTLKFTVPNFSNMGIYASVDMIEFFSHNPENNVRFRFYTASEIMEELKIWKRIKAVENERNKAYLNFVDTELKVQQALKSLNRG